MIVLKRKIYLHFPKSVLSIIYIVEPIEYQPTYILRIDCMTGRIQLRFLQLRKEARENITSAQFDAILILNAILCIACKRKPQSTIRWNEILKRNEQ